MKKIVGLFVAAAVVSLIFAACGIGLEPAKSGSTEVSFTINTLPVVGSDGTVRSNRAIVPGGGYLYVRMIGGPSTDKPFLGPYRVSGTDRVRVSITDIPAGSYDAMFVLLAATEVHRENVEFEDGLIPFADILSLPDEQFIELVSGDHREESYENEPDELDWFFKGLASFGLVENPRVRANVTNSFSMSLRPITPYWIDLHHGEGYLYIEEYPGSFRGFVSISGLDALAVSESLGLDVQVVITLMNGQDPPPLPRSDLTINRLVAYDGTGRPLSTLVNSPITLSDLDSVMHYVPFTGDDEMYLYLDIAGGEPLIEIDGGLDLGGPTTEVNSYLDLGNYASDFDEVHTVLFTTSNDLANLDNSTVGYAGTKKVEESQYTLTGFIKSSPPAQVRLVIIGEKFGVPVIYVTEAMSISESYNFETVFPVYQYAVVSSDEYLLASRIGQTMTLEMRSESTIVARGTGFISKIFINETVGRMDAAVILLVNDNGNPVVFSEPGEVSASTFSVSTGGYTKTHDDPSNNSLERAFIWVTFDQS